MEYQGPERRQRRVMVTANSEYHLRGNECVAVRNPKTGEWHPQHQALGQKVVGGIAFLPSGSLSVSYGDAQIGQKICFANDIMTSPVVRIGRPSHNTVDRYPRLAAG